MKKLLVIGGIIVAAFVLIMVLTNQANKEKLKENTNPYGDKQLNQATIDQLKDKNYQNIILPDELKKKIDSGEPVTAYFFSPLCEHCKKFTPVMMPIAKDMKVDIKQYNVLEYPQGFDDYHFEATPTMIHFKDGKQVARMVGDKPEETVKAFFNEVVLKK